MGEIQNSAVENTILNFLAASEINFEYPSLQIDAVDKISTNLSDIMYTTLKHKSIASSTKGCNLLKFLNNICQTPDFHLGKKHYKTYLNGYKQEFCKTEYSEAENLLNCITKELEENCEDLHSQVVQFYKRKNAKRKDKVKKQEFIKQLDQEQLTSSLGMIFSKSISHYETSENLIHDLLKADEKKCVVTKSSCLQLNSRSYREKQVKCCYALLNLGSDESDFKILEGILQKLSAYVLYERFEVKLLMDLWLRGDHPYLDLPKIVSEKFPFIVEKIVIQFCTDIIKLKDSSEVVDYFSNLSANPKIIRIQDLCTKNSHIYSKLKNLIHELYVFSHCNENVCRFSDYII